jgi:hypothetical protein
MTFFYDLNKRLADLAKKQDLTESVGSTSGFLEASTGDYSAKKARAGKDIGKPGKMFSKIAKSAGKAYGSKAAGERVAGAVLNKLRAKESVNETDMDESALQAYLGKKKYGEQGMKALQKAGREGASKEKMAKIRATHDKMDEADMEEGNRFTGNLMKARAAGLKKADLDGDGDMEAVREADVVGLGEKKKAKPDYIDLDRDGNREETMKKAAADKKKSRSAGTAFDPAVAKGMFAHKDDSKFDVIDTGYSKRYTRRMQDEPEADDEKSDVPKAKGRPKGSKRAIGAKGPTGRSKLMSKDSIKEMDSIALVDKGEYDREGEMAKQQMHTIMSAAKRLHSMLDDDENMPEWVQKKITLAKEYIDGVADYLASVKAEQDEEQPIAEKAVSIAQRRAAGIAHAAQKGEIPKKELRGASKEMSKMPKGELKKFAKTKEKGLPEKVKETDAEAPKEKKSSGGYNFGGSVYENLDRKFKQALTEGMNITVNMAAGEEGEPRKSITVTADGAEADQLAQLLKMAGMNSQEQETCATCGATPCGCESLDENSPDWPTNTETSDNALQYSGGLNGPKSTGQTTVPVIASQLRRQVSMEESAKLENDLFRLYQNYKA